ncbi:hypothetical protein IKQ19_20315 [Candidatus Saccharibacteria bacterium]|nr:hypothetical protein [Candidatus Saccharibacteria bacterium]
MLDSVTPVHIDVFKDYPFAYGLDVIRRIVLADMPDNLVLKEPHAKDNCCQNEENGYHFTGFLGFGGVLK